MVLNNPDDKCELLIYVFLPAVMFPRSLLDDKKHKQILLSLIFLVYVFKYEQRENILNYYAFFALDCV